MSENQILECSKPFKCGLCNKEFSHMHSGHMRWHKIKTSEYLKQFPDHAKYQFCPPLNSVWNRGLTAATSEIIKKSTDGLRKYLNTPEYKVKRAQINKEMWAAGRFKPASKDCLDKARQAWVERVKSVSPEERANLMANFVKSGNVAQQKIRDAHRLDIDFFNKKYPWAQNPRIVNCECCNKQFIITDCCHRFPGNKTGYQLCGPRCYTKYITDNKLEDRHVGLCKCKGCGISMINIIDKQHKFCTKLCYKQWTIKRGIRSVKKHYYSEKFKTMYIYDSSYELDFILWSETIDKQPIRSFMISYIYEDKPHKYYADFCIDNIIIETKVGKMLAYRRCEQELVKIQAGVRYANDHNMYYKLITCNDLYVNYRTQALINHDYLNKTIFEPTHYIGGEWKNKISLI